MIPAEEAARIRSFLHELQERCSTRTEGTAFGTAYLHADFPLRYDSNFVWVDRPVAGVDADALAADADRVLGEVPLGHRRVTLDDDEQGRRLAPEFVELGWSAERLVVMRRVQQTERRVRTVVRETGFDGARPILDEVLRRRSRAQDEEERRQLAEFRAVLEREAGARFFLAEIDGAPASVCELYRIGSVAQIEDVSTLEEHRGRGLASAVVLAAAAAARDRGCDLVFLIAEDADWPKELYGRLGFEPVAWSWSFLRVPA